jgi:hypothetical protein
MRKPRVSRLALIAGATLTVPLTAPSARAVATDFTVSPIPLILGAAAGGTVGPGQNDGKDPIVNYL